MYLARIKGENFRLFEKLDFKPHPRVTLITGENAAGKTSLLESIYCLGRAKSFRGNGPAELAGAVGRHWQVMARLQQADLPSTTVKVAWNPEGTSVRFGEGGRPTAAELVSQLPTQIIEPAMHRLLQDGPGYRRSFLDWGVFHVEHRFFPVWRRHQRVLKQRNKALRLKGSPRDIHIWDEELAASAELLLQYRMEHLSALRPVVAEMVARLFNTEDWSIELQPGWSTETPYIEGLRKNLERDRRMGMTVEGAHRAELKLRLNSHQVKNRISRGQQKLLISALILAQSELMYRHTGRAPILLVDDFSAELATEFQKALAGLFAQHAGQLFITAFERVSAFELLPDSSMFHVEHGRLREC